MNDRELLELAAKAAGIGWIAHTDLIGGSPALSTSVTVAPLGMWAPLTDDGDALRLAVKLLIALDFDKDRHTVFTGYAAERKAYVPIIEKLEGDAPAGVRRAIVRAAAEIGKDLSSTSHGQEPASEQGANRG